jgi:hypothetical protein
MNEMMEKLFKLKFYFLITFYLLIWVSCNEANEHRESSSVKVNVSLGGFSIVDTISFYNDSVNFRFSNLEKFLKDSILLFNYPSLDLHYADAQLSELRFINSAMDSREGFIGSFIQPIWDFDGGLIVVEQGNQPILSFFDSKFEFIKRLKLKDHIKESFYLPTISSRAIAYSEGEDTVILLTSETIENQRNTRDYFSSSYVFLKLILDSNKNYKSHSFHLKLDEFEEIKEALKSNKRFWSSTIPKFDVFEDKLYVAFEFSNSVYVFDLNLNLEHKIPIKFFNNSFEPYNTPIKSSANKDPNESVKLEFLIRHSKPHIVDIKVEKNKIVLLFNETVKKESIPTNIIEENNYLYQSFLHVIEKSNNGKNQTYIPLKDDFSPYEPIFLLSQSMLIYKNYNKSDGYEIFEIEIVET